MKVPLFKVVVSSKFGALLEVVVGISGRFNHERRIDQVFMRRLDVNLNLRLVHVGREGFEIGSASCKGPGDCNEGF